MAVAAAAAATATLWSQYESLYRGGPLYALEASIQDVVLRGRTPDTWIYQGEGAPPAQDPRQFITIVSMDDKSIEELGVFRSWPRTYMAQVVDNLAASGPRVIALDVGYFEATPEDSALLQAFDRARARRPTAPAGTAIVIAAAGTGTNTAQGVRGRDGDIVYPTGFMPIAPFRAAADVGAANVVPDELGSVRSMPLLVHVGDTQLPTLAFVAVSKYQRQPQLQYTRPSANVIEFAGRKIPVDQSGQVRINYFGRPSPTPNDGSEPTFKTVSFVDVMKGRADPATWRNGLVFLGLHNAFAFADDYWTPASVEGQKMAGVEIHANTAATLFSTQFLVEVPLAASIALIFLLAIAIAMLTANLQVVAGGGVALLVMALYGGVNTWSLFTAGVQYPLVAPIFGALLTFIAVTAYRVIIEQRQARALQGALASVIPPSVAQEIARDPNRVRMGGERRVISVLFTDLKGFTTFSESVDPELLSQVITEYLDRMTAVVFKYGGTVDKFIGDAVMAFWNAPLDDPDHARHACLAAIEMQEELTSLCMAWQARGLPPQQMRIGINTGPASVGNMGTSQRFAYTALGDTVNLGARLEPLNNEYGTWICISQATLDAAGGREAFLVRFLDMVAVKGKTEPVPVFELIGRGDDGALKDRYNPILEPFHKAMVLYQGRQFSEAERLFQMALAISNGTEDAPSRVYLERCRELTAEPPTQEWDGVYVMKHK
ncbi:MAG TPA: adenylate/guanylate cyclase domain-containing protein [Nonomuraea sp.]|nr:adenylate/guanylate cyclase domain-containing protein [Nonomuraea sp.]